MEKNKTDFAIQKNDIFQFECIPAAFLKLVIGLGILAVITLPFICMYVLIYAPALKIPAILAGIVLAVLLVILKDKWKDHYQFKIASASLIIQVNKKTPPMEFAYSQIKCFTLSLFVDGAGNQVSKLALFDPTSKKVLSIKMLNQHQQVVDFLDAWQQMLPVEVKVHYKNGALHAIERIGEVLGGFSKSTDIARIDFINQSYLEHE